MDLKLLVTLFIGVCIANMVSATFNLCGHNEGVDVCNTCQRRNGGITAPRPHPISSPPRPTLPPLIRTICREETIPAPKPLNPIGDVCNCGKQIVKPAPMPNIPRPSCLPNLPRLNLHHSSCSCSACSNNNEPNEKPSGCGHAVRAPEEYQIYNNDGATIYLDKPKKKTVVQERSSYGQADVVSVAIARQLANKAKNSVSEKQLQYGSLKEPIVPEKNEKKVSNNIREESFYETKGDVLEIKSNLFNRKPISSESESSEEEQPKPKHVESFRPAQLRYDDIGYAAYNPSSKPRYVIVKNSQAKHDCPHTTSRPNRRHPHRRPERPCNCHTDLVVDQSEQSLSLDDNNSNQLFPRRRIST